LAACLHADVTGYCRLIASDVESTVRTLTTYRVMMIRMVAEHDGRVVDTAGDSFLAEFNSVSAAVRCAVTFSGSWRGTTPSCPRIGGWSFASGSISATSSWRAVGSTATA